MGNGSAWNHADAQSGSPGTTQLPGLDRKSATPLYFQLAQYLEAQIREGRFPPGGLLEPENKLGIRFGLSRMTVRTAIQQLVDKGLVVKRQGVGTVVTNTALARLERPVALTSLFDELSIAGRAPSTKVLALGLTACPAELARELRLEPGSDVYHLRRIRYSHDFPIALMENYIPYGVVDLAKSAMERGGLYQQFRQAGISIDNAHQEIGARWATAEEADLLKIEERWPLLTLRRVTYDQLGGVIELGIHVYPADRYVFEMMLFKK